MKDLICPPNVAILRWRESFDLDDEFVNWVLRDRPDTHLWTDGLSGFDYGALSRFDSAHRLSSRSRTRRPPSSRGGSVLSWRPTLTLFGDVVGWARDRGTVAFAEWPDNDLTGWARAVRAYDFAADDLYPPLDDDTVALCERLAWHANNGFTRGFGRDSAERILRSAHSSGQLTREVITATAAFGLTSGKALMRLDEMVSRYLPPPPLDDD